MSGMIAAVALAVVLSTGLYLLVLGGSALLRPELARRFLGGLGLIVAVIRSPAAV